VSYRLREPCRLGTLCRAGFVRRSGRAQSLGKNGVEEIDQTPILPAGTKPCRLGTLSNRYRLREGHYRLGTLWSELREKVRGSESGKNGVEEIDQTSILPGAQRP
jgi:hypothetical protein